MIMRSFILCLLFSSCAAAAESHIISTLTAGTDSGVNFRFRLAVSPVPAPFDSRGLGGSSVRPGVESVERIFFDNRTKTYFGYVIRARRSGEDGFQVSFGPLAPKKDLPGLGENGRLIEGPKLPEPITMDDGDTLEIAVLQYPSTSTKIVDRIQISRRPFPEEATKSQPQPRNFSLEDVALKLANPQVRRNGVVEIEQMGKGTSVSGGYVWVAFPGKGRYILTATPSPQYAFEKRGVIERNVVRFTDGPDTVELVCEEIVLSSDGPWNLYVLHQAESSGSRIPQPAYGAMSRSVSLRR